MLKLMMKISSNAGIKKIHETILDILFPIHCISCGKEKEWICQQCLSSIPLQTDHVCPVCEKMITPDGKTCLACKRKSPLDGLVVSSSYENSLVSHAIHLFKYRFVWDLHTQLGDMMVRVLSKTDLPLPDLIIPVPLHPRRLRWRGFNQSSLLTKHVALNLLAYTQIPFDENVLVRKRYTSPQMEIRNFASRRRNIANAFSVAENHALKNKKILLIDDVATTGSTILECANELKKAGAKEVFAVVVARQGSNKRN